PLCSEDEALGKHAKLSIAHSEEITGLHSGQHPLAETLVAPRPLKGCHSLPEAVDRLTIVALGPVGYAEIVVCDGAPDEIPAGSGERQGALGGGDGLVIRALYAEIVGQKERNLSQPTRVVEGLGQGLGLAQVC